MACDIQTVCHRKQSGARVVSLTHKYATVPQLCMSSFVKVVVVDRVRPKAYLPRPTAGTCVEPRVIVQPSCLTALDHTLE